MAPRRPSHAVMLSECLLKHEKGGMLRSPIAFPQAAVISQGLGNRAVEVWAASVQQMRAAATHGVS